MSDMKPSFFENPLKATWNGVKETGSQIWDKIKNPLLGLALIGGGIWALDATGTVDISNMVSSTRSGISDVLDI